MVSRVSVCIADEGFGHSVREIAVITNLLRLRPDVRVTIYGNSRLPLIKERLGSGVEYSYLENHIRTYKTESGGLDIDRTTRYYESLVKEGALERWVTDARLRGVFEAEVIIGDSLPQLGIGKDCAKGAAMVNISHFTWDWFWQELVERNESETDLSKKFKEWYGMHDYFLQGPMTPTRNLELIERSKLKEVGLILQNKKVARGRIDTDTGIGNEGGRIKCLLMDNGTNSMRRAFQDSIENLGELRGVDFYIGIDRLSEELTRKIVEAKNVIPVTGLREMHKLMMEVDVVMARGGYNTISEIVAYEIPAILFAEQGNPEIESNLEIMRRNKWSNVVDAEGFNMAKELLRFLERDFDAIKERLGAANIELYGEDKAAQYIVDWL